MTAPRKDIPTCTKCGEVAYSGIIRGTNGVCYTCSTNHLSFESMARITRDRTAMFAEKGMTR